MATRPEHALRIVHVMPGRLRLRGSPRARGEELAEVIRGLAGVRSCQWSRQTGSLLVLFDPDAITGDAITEAVAEHAPVESPDVDRSHPGPAGAGPGQISVAATVAEAFGELDQRVHRATRGLLGLGTLVPLALTVWAAREIAIGRTGSLAWSTALWYAHGLFRDYHTPPR
jgi:hypothetical protein